MSLSKHLLPENWERVFEHLKTDAESLFQCSRTCTSWKSLLEKDMTHILFSLAVPVLMSTEALNKTDLMNCRRVCKRWRAAVNAYSLSSSKLSRDSSVYYGLPPEIWYDDTLGVTFTSSTDISKFCKDFPPGSNSPFFHGCLKIINWSQPQALQGRFLQDVDLFLRTTSFQDSIQKCILVVRPPQSDLAVKAVFTQLPNLRSFSIIRCKIGCESGFDWMLERGEALPLLPHLTCLNLYMITSRGTSIADILLPSYSEQLTSFHASFRTIYTSFFFFQGPGPVQSLVLLENLDIFDTFGKSSLLEILLNFNLCKLRRLSLEYFERDVKQQAIQSIVKILDAFSSSLEEVRLPNKLFTLEEDCSGEQSPVAYPVKLLRVNKLSVTSDLLKSSLREPFLAKFPNLKTVRIVHFETDIRWKSSDIKRHTRDLVGILWNLCPKLHQITVAGPNFEQLTFFS